MALVRKQQGDIDRKPRGRGVAAQWHGTRPAVRRLLLAILLVAAGMGGAAGAPKVEHVAADSAYVALYEGTNYSGTNVGIYNSVPDLRSYGGFNDRASSIQSTESVPVSVYSDVNYGGACQMVPTTGIANLAGSAVGDKTISSVAIGVVCPGEIVFYRDPNYQGGLYEDRANQAIDNFGRIGMNDVVSAIAIASGVEGAVYRNSNPTSDARLTVSTNACQPVVANVPDLNGSVVRNDAISGYLPGHECRRVLLFADKNYGGTMYTAPSLWDADLVHVYCSGGGQFRNCTNFNDVTSSIANFTGGPLAVYSDANFGGRCQTVAAGETITNLEGSYVGNDSIPSLQAGSVC